MSKTTSKQKYEQLTTWLETRKTGSSSTSETRKPRKFSKSDHYKQANNRYGRKKSN